MKALIVGAGLSGCCLARLLKDSGHEVSMIEKRSTVGGLCVTRTDPEGLKFEPFGARTFHTENPNVREFITRFDQFNDYTHRKGVIIDGRLFPFPITRRSLGELRDTDTILRELDRRPEDVDRSNFETACISIFGPTLYEYFIKNYTRRMWGTEPEKLTADWALKRLEFRENDSEELFRDQWQGIPVHGYSYLLERIIEGIPVRLGTTAFHPEEYDVVASTAPIDETLHYRYGRLDYRSIRFHYRYDGFWENDAYGTINLPQHRRYIRKCNFSVLHKQPSSRVRIQYQEPIAADGINMPMYPVNTHKNDQLFERYLQGICASENTCPAGRLGLFRFLDMDKAVEAAFDMLDIVQEYARLSSQERYRKLHEIRRRY